MRNILFFILLGISLCAKAQRHSLFLGTPLGGERDDFVETLEDKGFYVENENDECTTLSGLFDGINSRIEVHATPRSHTVHLVIVYFVEMKGNEIGLLMKMRQIRKKLRDKYASWDYTHDKCVEEWSSTFARVSLGKKKLKGDSYKTIYVQWQDRSGWEALQREK